MEIKNKMEKQNKEIIFLAERQIESLSDTFGVPHIIISITDPDYPDADDLEKVKYLSFITKVRHKQILSKVFLDKIIVTLLCIYL